MSEGETASGQSAAMVFDASVLIDICEAERELLGLMVDTFGPVLVPTPVLGEVDGLDDAGCRGFGLQLLEPNIDQMSEAASGEGALSFYDWLCLIVARDGRWTCVTNDAALLRTCQEQGVAAMRGLRVVLMLVESGVIDRRRAMTFIKVLQQVNPYIKPGVVTAFARELRIANRKSQR